MAAPFDVQQWLQQYQRGQAQVTMSVPEQVTCWTKTGDNDPEGNRFLFNDDSGVLPVAPPASSVQL
jgi:hypothetical protein